MIDLHSHILPGIDDGAVDLAASLAWPEATRRPVLRWWWPRPTPAPGSAPSAFAQAVVDGGRSAQPCAAGACHRPSACCRAWRWSWMARLPAHVADGARDPAGRQKSPAGGDTLSAHALGLAEHGLRPGQHGHHGGLRPPRALRPAPGEVRSCWKRWRPAVPACRSTGAAWRATTAGRRASVWHATWPVRG